MKLKVLIGILVFVVIVNIVAVDTYLYYHLAGQSAEVSPSRGTPTPGGGDDPLALLNDSQRSKLREFMEEFRKSTGELNGRIRILDDKIFTLLQEDSIREAMIDEHLKAISAIRLEISKIAIGKILETKSFLSKEQREQLFSAIFRIKINVPPPRKGVDSLPKQKINDGADAAPARKEMPPAKNRLKTLSERLGLTREQSTRLEALLNASQKEYAALEAGAPSDPADYRKKMKAIMDEEDARIETMLTDVQKKKFAEMKREKQRDLPKRDREE